MGSGLYFLKGLLEMRKRGFYENSLIKEALLAYGVHLDSIDEYFRLKNIGGVGFISCEWYET